MTGGPYSVIPHIREMAQESDKTNLIKINKTVVCNRTKVLCFTYAILW